MRAFLRALAALVLVTGWAGFAPAPASAQVQVSIRRLAPVEAIFLADLVPGSAGLRPDLLGITLITQGNSVDHGGSSASVGQVQSPSLVMTVVVAREDPSPVEIFRGTTDPFVVTEPVRHLTTRDLVNSGSEFALTDYTVNEDALEGAGLRSGRLPAGTYRFTVTVAAQEGAVLDSDELRITLGVASRVDLLSPGVPADAGAPPVIPGPTPRFLWSGESAGARYRLRVVRVDGEGSAVEAVQAGFPVWETVTSATSALYPASAQAIRLEAGGTYAWQVTREVGTSGGDELIESPIYWFRIDGAGGPGDAADPAFALLLGALGLSPELDGFTPVGARLSDGRVISLPELQALLAAIAAGEVPVLSVRVQ
ncbi:MAG TPA: hypothetical protein VM759_01155 [Longimicrobium sp.]|nr:hypothetical protein [Longimicrobium sp.]